MHFLTLDIGTGTQDVLYYDSALDLENAYKLVLPSPTLIVHRRLKQATARGEAVLLTGHLMGGGPSQWAARDHVRAGHPLYATPEAARTFNDDLDWVQREMGAQIVSDDEARALPATITRLILRDVDLARLEQAFAAFGVELRPDVIAAAVFDHGDAPPGYSDRQFRFDYLDAHCRAHHHLSGLAHRADAIPPSMTRLQAVASAVQAQGFDGRLMVMDTAPAAVLGTTLDPIVQQAPNPIIANIGNFHCLAFRMGPAGIAGVFEHHTGDVTRAKLEDYLTALGDGTLQHQRVFDDMGHGALLYDPTPLPAPRFLAVVGPRRRMLAGSALAPYFAVPLGDMMLAGCFGLLRALPAVYPELTEALQNTFSGGRSVAPWEI
jgi:uncharacterized protein (DUF1786 family)